MRILVVSGLGTIGSSTPRRIYVGYQMGSLEQMQFTERNIRSGLHDDLTSISCISEKYVSARAVFARRSSSSYSGLWRIHY